MKSKIALIALALFAGQASAKWEFINIGNGMVKYVDKSTIWNQGAYVAMWEMTDYTNKQLTDDGINFLSNKSLYLYNCRERTMGVKSIVYYGKNTGDGNPVYSFSIQPRDVVFVDVIPGSIGETFLVIACAKN